MEKAPFDAQHELCHELKIQNSHIYPEPAVAAPGAAADPVAEVAGPPAAAASASPMQKTTLPGEPRIELMDPEIAKYLSDEFMTEDLNNLAPHLWLMTTQSSKNVECLTEQLVRGRKIVISEKPGMHLVWIYNRVFLKPLPKYLLSYAFWEYYLLTTHPHIKASARENILRAARGFLRSYAYLIEHESDFVLATQEKTRLIPKGIEYADFITFISQCEANIDDSIVSPRYRFGELRLTRLNFWCRIFLFKATYEKVERQYGAYFARYYAPILFVFAVFSLLMSAMQLVLAVRTVLEPDDAWLVFARVARGFALFTIFFVACVIVGLLAILTALVLREAIYALKDRAKKQANEDQKSQGDD
jgi:hypothetical protein